MSTLIDPATIQRWEYEDEVLHKEMRDAAVKEAVNLMNSPEFSASLRTAASTLTLDDFRGQSDLGLNTRLVVEHPAFGDTLSDSLDGHGLLDLNADYLSDAAEAFVTTFVETMWVVLKEYENRRRS